MGFLKKLLLVFIIFSNIHFNDVFAKIYYGYASWYGIPFHGRKTASGAIFDMNKLTAAHRTLPFGTKVKVINLANNQSVIVTITDRGPFKPNRIIDVSKKAAELLGFIQDGLTRIRIEIIEMGNNKRKKNVKTNVSNKTTQKIDPQLLNNLRKDNAPKSAFFESNGQKTDDNYLKKLEIPKFKEVPDYNIYDKFDEEPSNNLNEVIDASPDKSIEKYYKLNPEVEYKNNEYERKQNNSEAYQSEMAKRMQLNNLDNYYHQDYYNNPDSYIGNNVDQSLNNNNSTIQNEIPSSVSVTRKSVNASKKNSKPNLKEENEYSKKVKNSDDYITQKFYQMQLKEHSKSVLKGKDFYKLQFGVYSNPLIAQERQKYFEKLNIPTEVGILPKQNKGNLIRVLTKKSYNSFEKAQEIRKALKKENIDTWIIKLN